MAEKFLDIMNDIALPVVDKNECEIVDSEFVKEGGQRILRFYVEKKQGYISLDDCVNINKELSDVIDSMEKLNETDSFTLEVSSPGVNRVLKTSKDFIKFSGKKVDVSLYKEIDARKKFTAVLVSYEDKIFTFNEGTDDFTIEQKDVGKINLHFDFEF